jgi:hypothetical protein
MTSQLQLGVLVVTLACAGTAQLHAEGKLSPPPDWVVGRWESIKLEGHLFPTLRGGSMRHFRLEVDETEGTWGNTYRAFFAGARADRACFFYLGDSAPGNIFRWKDGVDLTLGSMGSPFGLTVEKEGRHLQLLQTNSRRDYPDARITFKRVDRFTSEQPSHVKADLDLYAKAYSYAIRYLRRGRAATRDSRSLKDDLLISACSRLPLYLNSDVYSEKERRRLITTLEDQRVREKTYSPSEGVTLPAPGNMPWCGLSVFAVDVGKKRAVFDVRYRHERVDETVSVDLNDRHGETFFRGNWKTFIFEKDKQGEWHFDLAIDNLTWSEIRSFFKRAG